MALRSHRMVYTFFGAIMSNAYLSKNFTVAELSKSNTAKANKIDNTPKGVHLNNMQELVTKFLQPLREELGLPIQVNSGYRSEKLNSIIPGASKTSAHCYGLAVDIVCPSYGNAKKFTQYVVDFCKRKNIKFDQIIYEFNSWCHFGLKNRSNEQRGKLLIIDKAGTRAVTKF